MSLAFQQRCCRELLLRQDPLVLELADLLYLLAEARAFFAAAGLHQSGHNRLRRTERLRVELLMRRQMHMPHLSIPARAAFAGIGSNRSPREGRRLQRRIPR